MSKKQPTQNMGASVFTRLKNLSKQHGDELNIVLNRYAVERLLYRLGISSHKNALILKGGVLLLAWQGKSYRVTRDLDLLGYSQMSVTDTEHIFREICTLSVEPDDGINFLAETINGIEIRETARYTGVRIKLTARIANAKIPMQIDIGFGDIITPAAETIDYPTLLEMPVPNIRTYPRYTVIAEKFEAMIALGVRNSRLKDFYDIRMLSRTFDFEGTILKQALINTFERRGSALPSNTPFAFTEEFYENRERQIQWKNFAKQNAGTVDEQIDLRRLIAEIERFITPILDSLNQNSSFSNKWSSQNSAWG